MDYAITVRTAASFAEASAQIRDALKAQGFGVLTEIDVQSTLREKLGEQMEQYIILGACNPPLAHRALSACCCRATSLSAQPAAAPSSRHSTRGRLPISPASRC